MIIDKPIVSVNKTSMGPGQCFLFNIKMGNVSFRRRDDRSKKT